MGTLQGQIVRGARRRKLFTFCTQLCYGRAGAEEQSSGAAQLEAARPLTQSRSYSTLCTGQTGGQTNGYKTTSRSTDDLIQEIKSESRHVSLRPAHSIMSSSRITFCSCTSFLNNCIGGLELHYTSWRTIKHSQN